MNMGLVRPTLRLLRNSTQRRHVFRWLRSLQKDYLLKKGQPWLVFDAIDFLNSLTLEGNRVFEYGSGGSTLFWLNHGTKCVSVEHNPDWYKLMRHRLEGMDGIDYRLELPEPAEDKEARDIANPNLYLSEDVRFRGYNFRNYVCQIDPFPDNFFDIVLIDGRARPSCILHSVTKVKVGGMLILDNSERDYYLSQTRGCLKGFVEKAFRGAVSTIAHWSATTIFTRTRNS
jgi:hypothetical protein